MYKICAIIVRKRVAAVIEENLWNSQHGSERSTAPQRLFSSPEEYQTSTKHTATHAWEITFDNADQETLLNALDRFNIPDKTLKVVQSLCKEPKFRVKESEGNSTYRKQSTGIRQGPHSRHVFSFF